MGIPWENKKKQLNTMIIYKITNKLNNKVYIGLTTQSLEKRWISHKAEGKRGNKKPLYAEIRKYGIENFIIEEIDHATSLEELGELERKYIKQFDSTNRNNGYNLTYGGEHNELDANPRARLTTEEVVTIRNYYAECKLTCSQCWEQLYKDKISFSISIGLNVGLYLLTTLPFLSTKNLVKFHLISP